MAPRLHSHIHRWAAGALSAALLATAACSGSTASSSDAMATPPAVDFATELTPLRVTAPDPDPRVGLAPGLFDAGEAIWNMRLVSTTPPQPEFVGKTNSDLAFTGDYAIQGNYDGVQDAWTDFEWGAVSVRVLDSNDDGNPDTWETYAEGRMTLREVDRDDDGVRDAFYDYSGDSLVRERHDINNDRKIDLMVTYQARRRVKPRLFDR